MSVSEARKFCHLCGGSLKQGVRDPWQCSVCQHQSYNPPSPTVDIALFRADGTVLITKRGHEPAIGKYDLPGGFIESGENVESALQRELIEEIELQPDEYEAPTYITSHAGHYSVDDEHFRTCGLIYAAKLNTDREFSANDDVAAVEFVHIEDLDSYDFGLEAFKEEIRKAHKQLFGVRL